MRTRIYTMNRESFKLWDDVLPDYVIRLAEKKGVFTLCAAGARDGEEDIIGMLQFYINITEEEECFGEVIYAYVYEEYRNQGVALKLLERMNRILKKSGLKTSILILPHKDRAVFHYDLPTEELSAFFKECHYIKVNYDKNMKGTILSEFFPGISESEDDHFIRFTEQ